MTLPALARPPAKPPSPGDECVAGRALRVSARPKAGAKQEIPAGSVVRVLAVTKGVAEITSDGKRGFVPVRQLVKECQPPASAAAIDAGTPAASVDAEPAVDEETSVAADAPASPTPTVPASTAPAPRAGAGPAAPLQAIPRQPVPAAPAAPGDKIKIAVMDLRADAAVGRDMGQSLTAVVPQTLDELGPFKAISSQEIQAMLQLEKLKDSVGCDDVSCLAEIGGALGADYMVTGAVLLAGDTYWIQLQLSDIKAARVTGRVSREFQGKPAGLMDEMRVASKQLVRDILAKNSGRLLLKVSEEGATIRIDGSIVGTSPLAAMTIGGGVHTLAIEHEGFIRFVRDIEIRPGRDTALEALLAPSEEYRRAYLAQVGRQRTTGYVSLGVGVLGLAGAGALYAVSHSRAATLSKDVAAYNAGGGSDPAVYDSLVSRRTTVARLDVTTIVAAAVGLAGTITGASLWAAAGDPHRFDSAAPAAGGSVSTLHVISLPGGGALALSASF